MIKVKNLTRKFGTFTAVNSISFEIPRGQIVGLLGHNGAGKTTTLKMITGFLEGTSGEIKIDGMDINEQRLQIQSRIGYLPENSPLYPEMTVIEYLQYVARLRGIDESQIPEALQAAILATDLKDKASQLIATLSKGYKQRVGVAQAILHKPDILILDEPTNGLDPTQILGMRQLIKNLSKSSTIIISTHIMQEVEAICDRVLIVLNGRLAEDTLMSDLKKGNAINLQVKETPEHVEPTLRAVTGVKSVTSSLRNDGIYAYSVSLQDDKSNITPYLAKAILAKGWDLYSLSQEQRDLETVFREVNSQSKGAK